MKHQPIHILLIGALSALFLSAAQMPALPHAFYGTVLIDGIAAPVGTTVEGRGEGITTGVDGNPISVTAAGQYGGGGGFDPKLVIQGNVANGAGITFYVNGEQAEVQEPGGEWLDSFPYQSGALTLLNLRVGEASDIVIPTPTLTPTAPVYPTPTSRPTSTSAPTNVPVATIVASKTATTSPTQRVVSLASPTVNRSSPTVTATAAAPQPVQTGTSAPTQIEPQKPAQTGIYLLGIGALGFIAAGVWVFLRRKSTGTGKDRLS